MSDSPRLGLFEGYGVELEYMIVRDPSLDVAPIADAVFASVTGEAEGEFDAGPLWWSNELTAHVIELKTNGPVRRLDGLHRHFAADVRRINAILAPLGAQLMPTAMHPWMDPLRDTRLWTHDCSDIYDAFDRIFDCRGHGWANLQSAHLNLPFRDDAEFGRLHAAIRLVLPLLPAIAASSPVFEGRYAEAADARMLHYRGNAARVPSVAGMVVPEPVFSEADYRHEILERVYADLAPLDPEGVLRHEWVNARGAIARFERNTIEVRVIDVQECPRADLAIIEATVAVIRALTEERWGPLATQQAFATEPLAALLGETVLHADCAWVHDPAYLAVLGRSSAPVTAGELWAALAEELLSEGEAKRHLALIASRGVLARRIQTAIGPEPTPEILRAVYGELCRCLAEDRPFGAA